MIKKLIIAIAIGLAASIPIRSNAQQLIGSYTALLSDADHFNSRGQRLTTAAAIIRQNRANFHRFGIRSPEDQDDPFFASEQNRAALEQMLDRGRADPGVIERIVNGPSVLGTGGHLSEPKRTFHSSDTSEQSATGSAAKQCGLRATSGGPLNANGQHHRDRLRHQQRGTYRNEQSRHQRLRGRNSRKFCGRKFRTTADRVYR